MKPKFSPGQRVEMVIPSIPRLNYPKGTRATVVKVSPGSPFELPCYGIQMDDGKGLRAWEDEMRSVYDGDQVVSWTACAWRLQGTRR